MTRIPNVELFNADYRLHDTLTWDEAVSLMFRDAVHVVEYHDPPVHVMSPNDIFEIPASLVLKKYAQRPHKQIDPARASREDVLRRDKHTCAYCGAKGTTWDHVLPKSRGGSNGWLNVVAACEKCNHHKADRTPEEAGMKLMWEPYIPREKDIYFYAS